jgi:hypothetical protein
MNMSYVLPIKWDGNQPLAELTAYLEYLSPHVELIVVDGSMPENFEKHHSYWSHLAKHIAPQPDFRYLNGKVNGVLTGLAVAHHQHVVIADDDVRYELHQLKELDDLLANYELVSPQNYFWPCPWHAKWDSARSLLNLAIAHDYPGTLAVRRDFIVSLGGYDGNVLFENLELMRTVTAGGGKVYYKNDLLVRRLPPTTPHFWSQRIRQAYDDYAQPARLLFFFALLPLSIMLGIYNPWLIALLIAVAVAIAEIGRRKHGSQRVFAASCSFFAPAWLLERGICTWLALFHKLIKGGVGYNRAIITKAANSVATIQQKVKNKKQQ